MANTGTFTPFYEDSNTSSNSNQTNETQSRFFFTRDDYFDLYVPENINFWNSEEIGPIFFQTGQNYITGKNNNITIFNESKDVDIEQYKVIEEDEETDDPYLDEVLVEKARNPNPIKYKIFISDDGDKLKFLANDNINGNPLGNEILVFIEGDEDSFSSKKLYVKVGNDVQLEKLYLRDILNAYTSVDSETVTEIYKKLANGNSIEEDLVSNLAKKATNVQLYLFAKGKLGLNKITKRLNSLKLDFNEATFQSKKGNSKIEGYIKDLGSDLSIIQERLDEFDAKILSKLKNTFLGKQLAKAVDLATDLLEGFFVILTEVAKLMAKGLFLFASFLFGFINGVIDMLIGIIQILALSGAAFLGVGISVSGSVYFLSSTERDSIVEQIDNFLDSFQEVKIGEILSELWSSTISFVQEIDFGAIIEFFKNRKDGDEWYSDISANEFFYLVGYGVTFVIPTGLVARLLGVFGKAGKLMGKVLLAFDKVFEKIFNLALKGISFSFGMVVKIFRAIINKFSKGGSARKVIADFFESVRKLFDDIFPKWKRRRIALSNGIRGEKELSEVLKKEIIKYAKRYGIDERKIVFKDGISELNTSYSNLFGLDILYINSDVMPGILNTANSRLSWKAAIAHELEGHRLASKLNKTFFDKNLSNAANDLLEEMQASIRASILGKDLTKIEREDLLLDAMERFSKHSKVLKDTIYEKLNFNEIKEKLWISES